MAEYLSIGCPSNISPHEFRPWFESGAFVSRGSTDRVDPRGVDFTKAGTPLYHAFMSSAEARDGVDSDRHRGTVQW